MKPTAHLVKVMVQPSFVVVDENGAREMVGSPVEISGQDWRTFGASAFGDDDLAQVIEQYEARPAPPAAS